MADRASTHDELLLCALDELLTSHGLETQRYNEWVLPEGDLPALRALYFPPDPGCATGQVDFEVLLDAERSLRIIESFAAYGETPAAAVGLALEAFCRNTFHVLLAALWPHADCTHEEQTETETWSIQGRAWRATLGSYFIRNYETSDGIEIPQQLMDTLQHAAEARDFEPRVHWVRVYYFNHRSNGPTVEVLLDNEPWTELEARIRALPWSQEPTYSVRTFLIIQPAPARDVA